MKMKIWIFMKQKYKLKKVIKSSGNDAALEFQNILRKLSMHKKFGAQLFFLMMN